MIGTSAIFSPRRLDYALSVYNRGGDLKFVLPKQANYRDLMSKLKTTPVVQTINKLYAEKNADKTRKWLADENNYQSSINEILKRSNRIAYFVPLMPEEKIATLIACNETVRKLCVKMSKNNPDVKEIIETIIESGQNDKLVATLKEMTKDSKPKVSTRGLKKASKPDGMKPKGQKGRFTGDLNWMEAQPKGNTEERMKVLDALHDRVPGDPDKKQIERSLAIVNDHCEHSYARSVNSVSYMVALANHLFGQAERHGMGVDYLTKAYPSIFEKLLSKKGFYYTR